MEKQLFETETPENRVRMLEDNCDKVDSMEVKVPFSFEEKSVMKTNLAENLGEILTQDEKLKLAKDFHKEETKPRKEVAKDLTKKLRNGYEKQIQKCFLFADQEKGRMFTYNLDGEQVGSRKLFPQEKQTSILNINKKTA